MRWLSPIYDNYRYGYGYPHHHRCNYRYGHGYPHHHRCRRLDVGANTNNAAVVMDVHVHDVAVDAVDTDYV